MAQQESNYSTIFRKNPLAMIIIEKKNFKFLAVNPAANSIFGYPKEELLQRTFMDIVSVEDQSYLLKELGKVTEDKDIQLYLRNIKKNGQYIDMHIIATQINFEGKDCILKIASDIT
ncbi:MAG: PAS domain S-box protein [Bacteroidetes bacterium]|nr:PAS domain S-box protein [Bacteroidota bacterium]